MKSKVLISNPESKQALAIVKELNVLGYEVHVIGITKFNLSSLSKYVHKSHVVSYVEEDEFIEKLLIILGSIKFELFIPIGLPITYWASKHKDKIAESTKILIDNFDTIKMLSCKKRSYYFAKQNFLPVPKTNFVNDTADLLRLGNRDFIFPIVIKIIDELGYCQVMVANNYKELEGIIADIKNNNFLHNKELLIQEYLPGPGYGYFGLYNNGVCIQYFIHKRLREYPLSGGSSSFAESIYDSQIQKYGDKIFSACKYTGIGMVEFRKDVKGNICFLEVNPKFWGSFELSSWSNVRFMKKYLNIAIDNLDSSHEPYLIGRRFSWPFNGDISTLVQLKKYKEILNTLFQKDIGNNLSIKDLLPSVFLLCRFLLKGKQ